MLTLAILILFFKLSSQQFGGVIPLGYSTKLGVTANDLLSINLQTVSFDPDDYIWPGSSDVRVFIVAVGNFSKNVALNMSVNNIAYFITDDAPIPRLHSSTWLRINIEFSDISPIVEYFVKKNAQESVNVLVTDSDPDCLEIMRETSNLFKWSMVVPSTVVADKNHLTQIFTTLKQNIGGSKIAFSICSGPNTCDFIVLIFKTLLTLGMYVDSNFIIYMVKRCPDDIFTPFDNAGAKIEVVQPVVIRDKVAIVKKLLEHISSTYVGVDSSITIDGAKEAFNQVNMLKVILKVSLDVPLESHNIQKIKFDANGFLDDVVVDVEERRGTLKNSYKLFYSKSTKEYSNNGNQQKSKDVKALVFEHPTFLKSLENKDTSVANIILQEIFSDFKMYYYKFSEIAFSKKLTSQKIMLENLEKNENSISAFPIPVISKPDSTFQTQILFTEGIVMIKGFEDNEAHLFDIFACMRMEIWAMISVFLLAFVVTIILIKWINNLFNRYRGIINEDNDISVLTLIIDSFFQIVSSFLLVKLIINTKQPSIRLLFQFCWLMSILVLATFAACMAEQRLVDRKVILPFSNIAELLENTDGYKWFFLRNSSVVFQVMNSPDAVLTKFWKKAESEWPDKLFVETTEQIAVRTGEDPKFIFVCSTLEARVILAASCALQRTGQVDYLYGLGYALSGPIEFKNYVQQRITALNSIRYFESIQESLIGIAACSETAEKINMKSEPVSIMDLGGLCFITIAGMILSVIFGVIELILERFPMFMQWHKKDITFGEVYSAEVLGIQFDGIWIKLIEFDITAFVDSSKIYLKKNRYGKFDLQSGSVIKTKFLGNDPSSGKLLFTITEEIQILKNDAINITQENEEKAGP